MRYLAKCAYPVWLAFFLSIFPNNHTSAQQTQKAPAVQKTAGTLRVDETKVRLKLLPEVTEVDLPVEDFEHGKRPAHLHVEIVDTAGKIAARADEDAILTHGTTHVKIDMRWPTGSITTKSKADQDDLLFYRLRYDVTSAATGSAQGIVSVGVVTPAAFELHVAVPELANPGGHYAMRVRAVHPVTGRPVAGVSVVASLDVDADNGKPLLTSPVFTAADGFARIEFTLPKDIDDYSVDVTVCGNLGGFAAEADGEIQLDEYFDGSLGTDKTIYQPGQILHTRLMAFAPNHKAIANEPVSFEIYDPDHTLVYRTDATTSRFGIASADWTIPDNLRLGTYNIEANATGGAAPIAATDVQVSRYDLPTFAVTAKPDRAYYLSGQNASIEVGAEYLFGQPVARGHVRVVRETGRKWNFHDQKWDIEEGGVYEGDTDATGHYVAKIDLSKDYDDFAQNDYTRYQDLPFAAYFTDASTGRTEQRRLTLRITKDPIHIYVIGDDRVGLKGELHTIYVSTDYADGAPASCDVEIRWEAPDSSNAALQALNVQFLRRVRTDRYGVAKITDLRLPAVSEQNPMLDFIASDGKGASGEHAESIWTVDKFAGGYDLKVSTDKTLYKPDDPIEVKLQTNAPDGIFVVETMKDFHVLASRLVHVRGGQAEVEFLTDQSYEKEISINAYSLGAKPGGDDFEPEIGDSRTILFPKDDELKLNVKLGKASYKPGEEAVADLRVSGGNGEVLKSAVGLAVVDQAVEERAETDLQFGHNYGFHYFYDIGFGRNSMSIAGITEDDLEKIDINKPISADMELVAEILLCDRTSRLRSFVSADSTDLHKMFSAEIDPVVAPIKEVLARRYSVAGQMIKDASGPIAYLASTGNALSDTRDPWGTPYHLDFSVDRDSDVLDVTSAGPDKTFGTGDDFVVATVNWRYFAATNEALKRAVEEYYERTHEFISDVTALKTEMERLGVNLDSLRDPWGNPFRFAFIFSHTYLVIRVTSGGPDHHLDSSAYQDNVQVGEAAIDTFADKRAEIEAAVAKYQRGGEPFPKGSDQLRAALASSGIDLAALRDLWGHPLYATFAQKPRYADRIAVESYADYLKKSASKTTITPVTEMVDWLYLRSAGPDGVQGTQDDFDAASFSRVMTEQSGADAVPVQMSSQPTLSGSTGAISGTVEDSSGAVISGATVTATNDFTQATFKAYTVSDGTYLLKNLPAGSYRVTVQEPGFNDFSVTSVPVRSSSETNLDATLQVGSVAQEVMVEASVAGVRTETSSAAVAGRAQVKLTTQVSTPRLREYFPETLLWRPEIVTDDKGRAQVKFPLADNITTWKLTAVASTENGEVAKAEEDIRVFQPFFVEHDPPKMLTVGDEIALPVVLRNYLDRSLDLNVAMKPAGWFAALSPAAMKTQVAAHDSVNDVFVFRAVAPTKDGKQQVSAISDSTSDAISRSIIVRPKGQEKTASVSEVFGDSTTLDLTIPPDAIPNSTEATLKIYPNLNAHVMESIEAILERPYGCAEQTISSAYPGVLLLKYDKSGDSLDPAEETKARRYTEMAYERLIGYESTDGGFTYWARGDSDLALSVYAMRFLRDAQQFASVDPQMIVRALHWTLSRQQADGRWVANDWEGHENPRATTVLTAYLVRTIVQSGLTSAGSGMTQQDVKATSDAVNKALAFLKPQVDSIDEPYVIAEYALAEQGIGKQAAFDASVARLLALEHRQGDSSYWSLETNTPFYGWGLAGRVETTALVLQALAKSNAVGAEPISRGLLFLLQNQDRYGIWYSTQATINVLDAMGSLTSMQTGGASVPPNSGVSGTQAMILVDGASAVTVNLPPSNRVSGPVYVDVSKFVGPGNHDIEIRRAAGSDRASVQALADYYIPWQQQATSVESDLHHEEKSAEALRLDVHFDKHSADIGETIHCTVDAERVASRGYGMMLAEIGLPPGAEVDRASLDDAVKSTGWDINSYDILPDRVVVYLWPHAGGTKFSFSFKTRFGLTALSAPSSLYDYYNPEAQAVVEPVQFVVK